MRDHVYYTGAESKSFYPVVAYTVIKDGCGCGCGCVGAYGALIGVFGCMHTL